MASSRLLFGLLCFVSIHSAQAFTVSSDQQYFVYDENSYRFIYSEEYRPFIQALAARNAAIKTIYQKEFLWKLDEKPYLILASPRNQIANGFATVYPSVFTVFYGGGAEAIDEFSSASWLNTLLAHETSHLYQTDVKQSKYSQFLKSAFHNPLPNVVPPFTYMLAPNIFLPTFILEGNATFNEGRFGNGGRLYSGENRALFLSLLKAGKVNPSRLMNDHIQWPYGREKYVVGAYIQLYLAQKYGADKVNHFFLINSGHYINPLSLRHSFIDTFGVDYEAVFKDINREYSSYVAMMKTTEPNIEPIAKSISMGGLTRDGDTVTFMATDGYSMPVVYEVTSAGGNVAVTKKRHNMPFGKLQKWKGRYYSASGEQVSPNEIRYSLFTDNFKRDEQFDSKFVYATTEKSALYADVPRSFEKVQLYDGKKALGVTDSAARYDEEDKPLYFRQAGDQRTLYRDGYAVVTYKGYYGKIADATKNGDIYIIAATERGSGLFRVHDRTLTRILASDTIVDANILSEKEILVAEITDNGYTFKVVPYGEEVSETPFYYEYVYDKDSTMKVLAGDSSHEAVIITPEVLQTPEDTAPDTRKPNAVAGLDERPYSSTRSIKFDGIDPLIGGITAAGDIIAGVAVRFSDPMAFQSLNFGYVHLEGDTNDALLLYTNRFYKLNWALAATFDQSVILRDQGTADQTVLARYQTWKGILEFQYPILKKPQFSGDITSRYKYKYEQSNDPVRLDREQSVLTYLDFTHSRQYMLGYQANALDRLVIAHEAIGGVHQWGENKTKYAALASVSRDFWHQDYFTAEYHAVVSDGSESNIEINHESSSGLSLSLFDPTDLVRFSSEGSREYREARRLNLGYKKGVDFGIYFTKFPLSLRRFAPFANYYEYYGRRNGDDSLHTLFNDWVYGAEFELLLAHKFPFRLVFADVESSARKGSDFTTFVTAAQSF